MDTSATAQPENDDMTENATYLIQNSSTKLNELLTNDQTALDNIDAPVPFTFIFELHTPQ